jgi:Uma2 family endonuclease
MGYHFIKQLRASEGRRVGLPKLKPHYTVDQYLAIERASEERYEYRDGEIYAMAGESNEHGDISVNVVGLLHTQLRGKPCRVRTKDTKVRSGPVLKSGETSACLFSYPDVIVICGEMEFLDSHRDVILNPTMIAEVLSPSTEAFDRGEKFTRFQSWNPSLKEYVLISQDKPQIEQYTKQHDGSWTYRRYVDLESTVVLASIECILKLAEVYERVVFPNA